jgi:hypothetical protein
MKHTLTPAYGRDYKSKAAIKADLEANKDFVTNPFDGPSQYVNLEQLQVGDRLEVRYKKLTQVTLFTVTGVGKVK